VILVFGLISMSRGMFLLIFSSRILVASRSACSGVLVNLILFVFICLLVRIWDLIIIGLEIFLVVVCVLVVVVQKLYLVIGIVVCSTIWCDLYL